MSLSMISMKRKERCSQCSFLRGDFSTLLIEKRLLDQLLRELRQLFVPFHVKLRTFQQRVIPLHHRLNPQRTLVSRRYDLVFVVIALATAIFLRQVDQIVHRSLFNTGGAFRYTAILRIVVERVLEAVHCKSPDVHAWSMAVSILPSTAMSRLSRMKLRMKT